MPIAPRRPSSSLVVTPPTVTPDRDAGTNLPTHDELTTVNTAWVPKTHLLTALEGSPWRVNYYSQLLGRDSDLSGAQVTATGMSQSWIRIEDLEILVTSPLASSQDDVTKAMTHTGTARMYPCVVPNEGDHFTADLGLGQLGVLRVTSTSRLSIYKQACFEINYQVTNASAQTREALDRSVVQVKHYNRDFLLHGQNPLISSSQAQAFERLDLERHRLVREFIDLFYSKEYATFLAPDAGYALYDPFVVSYLVDMIDPERYTALTRMRRYGNTGIQMLGKTSLMDAFRECDPDLKDRAFRKFRMCQPHEGAYAPWLMGMGWVGFDAVVFPDDGADSTDLRLGKVKRFAAQQISLSDPYEDTPKVSPKSQAPVSGPGVGEDDITSDWVDLYAPVVSEADPRYRFLKGRIEAGMYGYTEGFIKPANEGGYYLFSEAFYTGQGVMSSLEGLVNNTLKGERPDLTLVCDLLRLWHRWRLTEKFYYAAPLLFLIHCAKRMPA